MVIGLRIKRKAVESSIGQMVSITKANTKMIRNTEWENLGLQMEIGMLESGLMDYKMELGLFSLLEAQS